MAFKNHGLATGATHRVLSTIHHALHPALLPLPAHLLGICKTSPAQAWAHQGNGIGRLANIALQPMGRQWLRPSAVGKIKRLKYGSTEEVWKYEKIERLNYY